jgi:hypothetical protein
MEQLLRDKPWLVLVVAGVGSAALSAAATAKQAAKKEEDGGISNLETAASGLGLTSAAVSAAVAYLLYDNSRRGSMGYLANPTYRAAVTALLYAGPAVATSTGGIMALAGAPPEVAIPVPFVLGALAAGVAFFGRGKIPDSAYVLKDLLPVTPPTAL